MGEHGVEVRDAHPPKSTKGEAALVEVVRGWVSPLMLSCEVGQPSLWNSNPA